MVSKIIKLSIVTVVAAGSVSADFSYEQTSRITGGMMAGMMRFAGAFSRQAREPIRNTVAVKGDRMVHLGPNQSSIIDLGRETITSVDFQKKTYSVMTFAEMKQALEKMAQRMQEQRQPDLNFKVSVNATGQTKQIAGFDAKEMVMKLEMEGTDQKTGQKGGMTITTNMWIAPRVAGYQEVADFSKRMAEKLNWTPGGNFMMSRPDVAKGMAAVYKEASKLDGMPVYQVIKMGVEGQGESQSAGSSPPPSQQPRAQEQQAEKPSVGSVLGGRLGRFGGLGRKKKEEPRQEEAQPAPAAQAPPQAPADASGVLLEMTTETSGFSAAPVDSSKFEVPAGYKQVESELKRMR